MKWPEKKTGMLLTSAKDYEARGWNACIDAHEPIRREVEGMNKDVLTVTCPSCQKKFQSYTIHKCKESHPQLVPLDRKLLVNAIYAYEKKINNWECNWIDLKESNPDKKRIYKLADFLINKFGQPNPELPSLSVEEMKKIMDTVDYTPVEQKDVNKWTHEHTKYAYAKAIHQAIKERK